MLPFHATCFHALSVCSGNSIEATGSESESSKNPAATSASELDNPVLFMFLLLGKYKVNVLPLSSILST